MKRTWFLLFALNCLCENSFAGWQKLNSGTNRTLRCVTVNHSLANGKLWVCGDFGTILYSSNGGDTWVFQNSGTTNNLYTITFKEVTGGPVFAAGANGIILRTTNDGTTWTPIPSGTTATLRDHSDFQWFIVGDSGVVLKSTDNGLSWARKPSGTTARLYSVAGFNPIHAVGENGTVIRALNQGESWQVMTTNSNEDLYAVPMFGTMDFVFGSGSQILRSSNFGVSWFTNWTGTNSSLRSAEFSANNNSHIYAVGDNGVILKTTDSGTTWGKQQTGTRAHLRSVFFYLNDQIGFACGDSGVILRTTDGGGTFPSLSDSLKDMFPLAVGNQWRYRYFTNVSDLILGSSTSDSGTASLRIIAAVVGKDSTKWLMKQHRDVRNCISYFFPPGGTTCQQVQDSVTFEVIERHYGRHRIYTQSGSSSIFPITKNFSEPAVAYRYSYPESASTVRVRVQTAPYPYVTLDLLFKSDSGLVMIKSRIDYTGSSGGSDHRLTNGIVTSVKEINYPVIVRTFVLHQNYPNPFNPETNISFDLPKNSFVTLKIFNLIGQEVATIVNEQLEAGTHTFRVDKEMHAVSSGVYFYRMSADAFMQTRKMVFLR